MQPAVSLSPLLIFQHWLQIFARNSTWLLNNQTYTLSPSLFEICQKMTKLCCFNQDNPHFPVIKLHAELTDRMWTGSLRRLSGPQTLQIWTHWTDTSGAPCWKSTRNSSWSLTRLMSWKSPCRLPGKSCHKNTSTRWWTTDLHQVPDCLRGCGCQWLSLLASAVTLSVSKSASSCHQQQTGSFQSHEPTTSEVNPRNAEKCGLSWMKFCHFPIDFDQTWW